MHTADHIDALRRDGARIIAAAEDGLGRVVPSCTGWNIGELVWHVGIVHTFWRGVAAGVVDGPDSFREPARPADDALVAWFAAGLDETADTLLRFDPATPAWTWGRRKDVGFIARRLAHETAIHCWDAVDAIGAGEPVEAELAGDGVAEFLDEVLPGMSRDLGGTVQVIALHANDIHRNWTVRTGLGCCQVVSSGVVDATVSATASQLLLCCGDDARWTGCRSTATSRRCDASWLEPAFSGYSPAAGSCSSSES